MTIKPSIYTRYVDDIFVVVENENKLLELKSKLEETSILKFTCEISTNNYIPFLDVNVKNIRNRFITSIYTKDTNDGNLINFNSECPKRYKIGTIVTLLNRALKISTNWELFHDEVKRLKQLFVNNNFPNYVFDECLKNFLNKRFNNSEERRTKHTYNVYYENQMTKNYKLDERILTDIIKNKIKCINSEENLKFNIYYKNLKTKNLLMKNNIFESKSVLKTSHVVYKINCPSEDCELPNPYYVGQTQNTVSLRLTGHLQNSAIKEHMINQHRTNLTRNQLEKNVKIIKKFRCSRRLVVYEALSIMNEKPGLNIQGEDFSGILKLFL